MLLAGSALGPSVRLPGMAQRIQNWVFDFPSPWFIVAGLNPGEAPDKERAVMRSSFCASVLLVALSVALRAAPQSVVPSQPSQPHDGASQALSPSLTVIPGPL